MAKSKLLARLDAMRTVKHGRTVFESMTPAQRKEFLEVIDWMRSKHPADRPPIDDVRKLLEQSGIKVSGCTLQRYVRDGQ